MFKGKNVKSIRYLCLQKIKKVIKINKIRYESYILKIIKAAVDQIKIN